MGEKTVSVYISGIEHNLREGSLSISHKTFERTTASVVVRTDQKKRFYKGEEVKIYNELGDTIAQMFGGVIDSVTFKDVPNSEYRFHTVHLSDYIYFAQKKVIGKVYKEMFAGDIVKSIIEDYLEVEGITMGKISQGVYVDMISFNYIPVSEAINRLAELCGFEWNIGFVHRELNFKYLEVNTQLTKLDYNIILEDSLEVVVDSDSYINQVYVKGGRGITDLQTRIVTLQEEQDTITLRFNLHEKPSIWVNNEEIQSDDIVLKGYNDTSLFFYESGESIISINSDREDIKVGDTIRIEYIGLFATLAKIPDYTEIARTKDIEGGSGEVEKVISKPELVSMENIFNAGTAELNKYSKENLEISFTTEHQNLLKAGVVGGIWAGELINVELPKEDIDEQLLVEELNISDEGGLLWYDYKLVRGVSHDSWVRLFEKLSENTVGEREEVVENEVIITAHTYEYKPNYEENPNILRQLKCGEREDNAEIPVCGVFNVNATPEKEVRFLEIDYIDESEDEQIVKTYRVHRTTQVKNTEGLSTSYYLGTANANGKWVTLRFYNGNASQSKVGKGSLIEIKDITEEDINKTTLDIVQIIRNDIKQW